MQTVVSNFKKGLIAVMAIKIIALKSVFLILKGKNK